MLGMLIQYLMWLDSQAGQCGRRKVALKNRDVRFVPDGVPWLLVPPQQAPRDTKQNGTQLSCHNPGFQVWV